MIPTLLSSSLTNYQRQLHHRCRIKLGNNNTIINRLITKIIIVIPSIVSHSRSVPSNFSLRCKYNSSISLFLFPNMNNNVFIKRYSQRRHYHDEKAKHHSSKSKSLKSKNIRFQRINSSTTITTADRIRTKTWKPLNQRRGGDGRQNDGKSRSSNNKDDMFGIDTNLRSSLQSLVNRIIPSSSSKSSNIDSGSNTAVPEFAQKRIIELQNSIRSSLGLNNNDDINNNKNNINNNFNKVKSRHSQRVGPIMNQKWWFQNIILSLTPALLLALICESYQGEMNQFTIDRKKLEYDRVNGVGAYDVKEKREHKAADAVVDGVGDIGSTSIVDKGKKEKGYDLWMLIGDDNKSNSSGGEEGFVDRIKDAVIVLLGIDGTAAGEGISNDDGESNDNVKSNNKNSTIPNPPPASSTTTTTGVVGNNNDINESSDDVNIRNDAKFKEKSNNNTVTIPTRTKENDILVSSTTNTNTNTIQTNSDVIMNSQELTQRIIKLEKQLAEALSPLPSISSSSLSSSTDVKTIPSTKISSTSTSTSDEYKLSREGRSRIQKRHDDSMIESWRDKKRNSSSDNSNNKATSNGDGDASKSTSILPSPTLSMLRSSISSLFSSRMDDVYDKARKIVTLWKEDMKEGSKESSSKKEDNNNSSMTMGNTTVETTTSSSSSAAAAVATTTTTTATTKEKNSSNNNYTTGRINMHQISLPSSDSTIIIIDENEATPTNKIATTPSESSSPSKTGNIIIRSVRKIRGLFSSSSSPPSYSSTTSSTKEKTVINNNKNSNGTTTTTINKNNKQN